MQLDSDHATFLCALLRMSPPEKVLTVAIALAGAAGDAFGWATENDPENEFGKIFTNSFGKRLQDDGDAFSNGTVSDSNGGQGSAQGPGDVSDQ